MMKVKETILGEVVEVIDEFGKLKPNGPFYATEDSLIDNTGKVYSFKEYGDLKCVYGDLNKLTVPQIESQYRRISRK
jgi:hypothetical protein